MKRILFVMPKMQAGGAEKSLLMLLETLKKNEDNEIDLLLFKHEGLFLSQVPAGVNIIFASEELGLLYNDLKLTEKFSVSFFKKFLWKVRRYYATGVSKLATKQYNERNQYRWIHYYKKWIPALEKKYDYACGYLDGETVYYVVDKVDASYKYVWNQNDYMKIGLNKDIDSRYYEEVDKVICLSDECQSIFLKAFPYCSNKIVQLPPIISSSFLEARAREYEAVELTGDEYSLLSIGRMTKQKGFDLAILAANFLNDMGIQFKWYFIGAGELLEELVQKTKELGLDDRVLFLGEKSNPYPYLQKADLFVQPSRFEGKSVILSEAKAMNKMILATDYDTVFDQLEDGVTGIIVKKDPLEIAQAIARIQRDEALRLNIEKNLKQQKSNDFDLENKYLMLFEERFNNEAFGNCSNL